MNSNSPSTHTRQRIYQPPREEGEDSSRTTPGPFTPQTGSGFYYRQTDNAGFDDTLKETTTTTNSGPIVTNSWVKLLAAFKNYILKPYFYGAFGSFGMCAGYYLWDVVYKKYLS
eukprot:TRINITY_DN597_c0_g1_i1.p1 TRINITY_DN597_c0_g1~~TRINITY_DN597_c0_g1_i1.p1  ORF type:complete len:114 (-),score=19.27 TRINITY_DN597_c0_g1_i1:44-385(-)